METSFMPKILRSLRKFKVGSPSRRVLVDLVRRAKDKTHTKANDPKAVYYFKNPNPHNTTSVTLVAGNLRKLLSKKYILNLREEINKSRRDKWAKSRKGFEAQPQKT
jgi:hypothetical protein